MRLLHTIIIATLLGVFSFSVLLGAFNEEEYMFKALDLQQKEPKKARDMYLVLYEETQKLEYLKESILLSGSFEPPQMVLSYIEDFWRKNGDEASAPISQDMEINKVSLDAYLKLNKLEDALKLAKYIESKEDEPVIHNVLGVLYLNLNQRDEAFKHFEILYNQTRSPEILQRLLFLYKQDGKINKAVELLDSHLAEYPCSEDICLEALLLYDKVGKIQKLQSILQEQYNQEPNIANAQSLIYAYTLGQKYIEALKIAKNYPFEPRVLFELYVGAKDYKNAQASALEAYKSYKEPMYLGFSHLYAFETLADKKDTTRIKTIITDMQQTIDLIQKDSLIDSLKEGNLGVFYNFVGYLMIDYDIDLEKGVWYVQKALEIAPNDVAYLDSLAWGYYKQNECKKAREVFSKIPKKEIKKDDELSTHSKKLNLCK